MNKGLSNLRNDTFFNNEEKKDLKKIVWELIQ